MVINRVAGCAASRRASVDLPAAILPQRRYKVVGRPVSIVAEYQRQTTRQLLPRVIRDTAGSGVFAAPQKPDVKSERWLRCDAPNRDYSFLGNSPVGNDRTPGDPAGLGGA